MELSINGHTRSFPDLAVGSNLAQLVEALGIKADRVAIEQNGDIVPRSTWTATVVREGDRFEIVHFVGGGC
jgi:thiamine biosynthesis protein ThiS